MKKFDFNKIKDFDRHINLSIPDYENLTKQVETYAQYFIEEGKPKHVWETAVSAVVINQAAKLDMPVLVCYGENGEQEYGGSGGNDWKMPVSKMQKWNI